MAFFTVEFFILSLFSSFYVPICTLSVNSQTPPINARGNQDSQSQRVKIVTRPTVDIKTVHTLNSKVRAGGGRVVRPPLAVDSRGCKLNTLHKRFDFQRSTNFKLLIQIKGYSLSNSIFFFFF